MIEKNTTFRGRFHDLREQLAKTLELLDSHGIPVNPSSRFRAYLKQLDAAVKADGVTVPPDLDLSIWHRSLLEIDDLNLVVTTLSADPAVTGWKESVERALSGGLRRSDELNHSSARDIQFELVLAAILRKAGYNVELTEPDVLVPAEAPPFGFAAKRPRSAAKLAKNIQRADKQILRSGLQGIVAVDLSCLVSPTDAHLITTDFGAAFDYVKDLANGFIRRDEIRVRRLIDPLHTFGIIVHVATPIFEVVTPRLAYARRWAISNLCELDDPRTQILRNLANRLAIVESAAS